MLLTALLALKIETFYIKTILILQVNRLPILFSLD